MKQKAYITISCSHLAVLVALVTPIIRVTGVGGAEESTFYTNIFNYVSINMNALSTVIMLILIAVHFVGIANAAYGIIKKNYNHFSINMTFLCGFASALMGALFLYSKSYMLFTICALSFLIVSFCSIKLIKSEG